MTEQQKSQRGANLTQADRERGGRVSAAKQVRDARGKFAGAKKNRDQRHEDQEQRQHQHQHKSGHEQGG